MKTFHNGGGNGQRDQLLTSLLESYDYKGIGKAALLPLRGLGILPDDSQPPFTDLILFLIGDRN